MPIDQGTVDTLVQGGTAGLILGLLIFAWLMVSERLVPGRSARDREAKLLSINDALAAKVTEQTEVVRSLVGTVEKQTATIARLTSRLRSRSP